MIACRRSLAQQGIDTVKLMQSVALYNEEITGSEEHAPERTQTASK
jgi:hypothetical protein